MTRIPVVYKGHNFIAIADGAGLDVESIDLSDNPETSGLGGDLWHAIYKTRISLFPNYEQYDTTPSELITCLETMGLIQKQLEENN